MIDIGDLPITWRHDTDKSTYENARIGRVFNHRRPKRYPLGVVEAKNEEHIFGAVRLAKQLRCRVSVRSGGHSWAAWSVRDDAILIDLGQYRQLTVDEESLTAVVSPSTTGRILNNFLNSRGLMFGGGHCPDVGLGGFLLQGELGLASAFFYPISEYRAVMDWVIKISADFDDGTEIATVAMTPPGSSEICIMPLFVTFKQTVEESIAALEPANSTRPPGFIQESINQPTSIADQCVAQELANPEGHRYCADNAYISNSADVPAVLEKAFTTLPNPKAFALLFAMNPCSRRTLPDMALSMQSDHYFALYTIWEDEKDDSRCQQWVRDIMKDVEQHSEGAYLGDSDFQVRRTKFWADENAKRLMELRRTWDPEGRICGYLDVNDASGTDGLQNIHEWKASTTA